MKTTIENGTATTSIFNEETGRTVITAEQYNAWIGAKGDAGANLKVLRFLDASLFAHATAAGNVQEVLLAKCGVNEKPTKAVQKVLDAEAFEFDKKLVRVIRGYEGIGPRVAKVVSAQFEEKWKAKDLVKAFGAFGIELDTESAGDMLNGLQAVIVAEKEAEADENAA